VTALVLAGWTANSASSSAGAVRAHMKVCAACPRFARQVALMQEAKPRWRAYRDGGG